MRSMLFGLIATALLAGCASTSTQYYRLPDSQYSLPAQAATTVLNVKLTDSLYNLGLVYQSSATEIHFARNHMWGEDLADGIAKSLANELNRQPNGARYTVHRSTSLPVMTVHIEAFQGQYNGHTRISGYTTWSDGAHQGRNFQVETAQAGDGYAAMVQSLATGLKHVAHHIGQ